MKTSLAGNARPAYSLAVFTSPRIESVSMAGEHLDLCSEEETSHGKAEAARPFVGIRFACCEVYARVYRDRDGTAYVGHCPRCLKRVELKVAPGGSESRFFTAY